MQVSWIDPDEIARLAAQLEGPLQREELASWNLATLPELSLDAPSEENGNVGISPLSEKVALPAPAGDSAQESPTPPEVAHLREKLRTIRDRARQFGVLPPVTAEKEVATPEERSQDGAQGVGIENPESNSPPPPTPISGVQNPTAEFSLPPPSSAPSSFDSLPAIGEAKSKPPFPTFEGTLAERLQGFMHWAHDEARCDELVLADDHGELLWGHPGLIPLALPAVLAASAGVRSGMNAAIQTSVFIRTRLEGDKVLSVLPCSTRYGMVTLALLNAPELPPETIASLREVLVFCIEGKPDAMHAPSAS